MHLKNVVITYKSQILKFKIQQKVLNKMYAEQKFEKVKKITCFFLHFKHPVICHCFKENF